MLKSYMFLAILLAVLATIYASCVVAASAYNNYVYGRAVALFNSGVLLDHPDRDVLPLEPLCLSRSREFNIIYNEINHLADKNNVILIGSSTVINGILAHKSTIPPEYAIHNMAISGGLSVREMILMMNYINGYADHVPDKSDLVVIHLFYSSFKVPPANEKYVTQLIEAYDVYRVGDDLQVRGWMPGIYREWMASKSKIMMAISSFTGINMFTASASLLTKALEISNNVVNIFAKPQAQQTAVDPYRADVSPHSAAQVAEYKAFWYKFTSGVAYPSSETDLFKEHLTKWASQTNVVVIDMNLPSWQRDIAAEKGYEKWKQSDLVPFLNANGIAYVDFTNDFKDDEYADSGHLNRSGREHFTELFDDSIKPLLEETH